MTDLIAAPAATAPTVAHEVVDTPPVEWAPQEAAPKKRRRALWIGLGAGALLLAAGGASAVLIAPGTTVAGVPVGWMTPGMAADAISAHLADSQVTLTGVPGKPVVSGADLGATVDAKALAEQAFAQHPMWNVTAWMPEPIAAKITLDASAAESTLRAAAPASYTEPIDASVTFDTAAKTFVTTAAVPGTGIDLDALNAALSKGVTSGDRAFDFAVKPSSTASAISDVAATEMAATLNTTLSNVGFYVGEERTVPVAPEVAASWISVANADGKLAITADPAAIQTVVATLPDLVNREAKNATVITNSAGKVLKTITAGVTARALGDTADVASAFAQQLEKGNGVFELNVTETEFQTTTLFRRMEVDLSEQRAYAYENGKVVNSWAISSGLAGSETDQGKFTVYAQLRSQNMGNAETVGYYTPNVPYVSYYNADEAFHGAYWHNNFGNPMSHGCVNMPVDAAKYVYDFTTVGTEVWVHG